LKFSLAREQPAVVGLLRLTWLVTTAFVLLGRLRGRALLMATTIVRSIRAVTTTTTVAATTAMHAETVLVAVALVAVALVAITLVAIALIVTVLP
jgi:hypothetical protein